MSNCFIEKIYQSSLKFLDYLSPQETYAQIIQETMKLVGAEHGSIFLGKDGNGKMVFSTFPCAFTYKTFMKQDVVIVPYKEIVHFHPESKRFKFKSLILITLAHDNNSFGYLSLLSTQENYFNENKIRILKLLGSMASLAIYKTQLYNDLKTALEARDLFIAMMAHELRTPLTTVNLYNQMLQQKKCQTQTPIIDNLDKEIKRLTRVVNQLLEADQIKTNEIKYEFKEIDLKRLLTDAGEYFNTLYPKRKIIIDNHLKKENPKITADPRKLLQAIANLLTNAAKFSPTHSDIFLDLKKRKDHYLITVKDLGKGIPEAELDKVCECFYKGSNHKMEGLGLGLFYAKQVISSHHGSVNIVSKINSGTTVEVKLPAR